ncbi:MAG: alpha/beta hydrolase [Candidatus Cyclonatronum sp.]|uniref:esterase/lipase family protein n=1 Tax=Cyclonatronum sp. TaxID=3024185 RepID=UPI0025C2EF9E|nr:alpha/beta hydrolase [Cyclonatronum sp.]MCH8486207.1 alpha/beta hydrolase [Cyclonatronum sp.]
MAEQNEKATDLQGLTRLIRDATIGIVDLVEAMQHRVVHPPFLPTTRVQVLITAVASFSYNSIRRGTRFVSGGADRALGGLAPLLGNIKSKGDYETLKAILNGVFGDHLYHTGNPLEIEMQFRHGSESLPLNRRDLSERLPDASGKILVMVHGSCMNDRQWSRKGHNHGALLAAATGRTPVYLHYNSGLHISQNGRKFSALLERLVSEWPVPVEELCLLTHSMGGLASRSALYYGREQQATWPQLLKKMVFMGTPHHGAPLERLGNYADQMLSSFHYIKPFALLGQARSTGVTDMRFGNLTDEDWLGQDRFALEKEQRQHIPLPEQTECYAIAAVLGKSSVSRTARIAGDGLVGVNSALGRHKEPNRNLLFKPENVFVIPKTGHLDLLSSPAVYEKVRVWMG